MSSSSTSPDSKTMPLSTTAKKEGKSSKIKDLILKSLALNNTNNNHNSNHNSNHKQVESTKQEKLDINNNSNETNNNLSKSIDNNLTNDDHCEQQKKTESTQIKKQITIDHREKERIKNYLLKQKSFVAVEQTSLDFQSSCSSISNESDPNESNNHLIINKSKTNTNLNANKSKTIKLEELIRNSKKSKFDLKHSKCTLNNRSNHIRDKSIDCCISIDSTEDFFTPPSPSSISVKSLPNQIGNIKLLQNETIEPDIVVIVQQEEDVKKQTKNVSANKQIYKSNLPNDEIISYFKKKSHEWKHNKNCLVDSHCHFDMLFPRIKFNKSTIEEYFEDFDCYYLSNFEACVNVICDPSKFPNKSRLNWNLKSYNHPKIYLTFGCHPHFSNSWTDQIEDLICQSLSHPRVVAIGECGLDLSKKNKVNIKQQTKVFECQLKIAKETNTPIVIHCRETEERVYELLVEHLDPDHRIHLHCFTGTWLTAKKYLDTFKNLCIGVTPLITNFTNLIESNNSFVKSLNGVAELVKNIPLDRLLLETDAPYFVPRINNFPLQIEYSHPGFVFATAESIAELKNVNINELIESVRQNVKRVYAF